LPSARRKDGEYLSRRTTARHLGCVAQEGLRIAAEKTPPSDTFGAELHEWDSNAAHLAHDLEDCIPGYKREHPAFRLAAGISAENMKADDERQVLPSCDGHARVDTGFAQLGRQGTLEYFGGPAGRKLSRLHHCPFP